MLHSYPTLARWLWRAGRGYRKQSLLNVLLGALMVVADLSFVWATKLAIDIATGATAGISLTFAIILLVALIILQMSISISGRWVRALLGVRAQNDMQRRLFHRLLLAEWQPLRRMHTGDLINRLERDVTDIVNFTTESLPSLLTTVLQFLGAFCLLFWMDRTLACIVVLVLPFFILSSRLYMRRMRRITHDVRTTESRLQSILQESLQHVLVIKTLQRASFTSERLRLGQATLRSHIVRKTKYATFSSLLMNLGFATGYVVTFTWGVLHLQQGLITYGSLIAFVQLVGQIQTPVRALTRFVPVFIGAFTAAERIIEIEQIPVESTDGFTEPSPPPGRGIGIAISHMSYDYGAGSRPIFRDFSYVFPPGSVTAIVGPTGSGKTTLIRQLLALVRPTGGSIHLFAADATEPAPWPADPHDPLAAQRIAASSRSMPCHPSRRSLMSYVPQGNTLLSGTIRDNLLLGNPSATDAQLRQALLAAAADFVFTLPQEMDSPLSEMGVGLSEGQAQRIGIARALLRPAPILLLDEATSSLDETTERQVLRNIIREGRGRTLIFVTHRPEVLKYCDQVLRLHRCK